MRHDFLTAFAFCLSLLAAPLARADVAEVVADHARPGYSAFRDATAQLNQAAQENCAPAALQGAFHAAQDAWMGVAHLHLGPAEEGGLSLAILFWPDPKGSGGRTLAALIREQNPVISDPSAFAQISVAARGFTGLEPLLFDPELPAEDYTCGLTRALTADLAASAQSLAEGWNGGIDDLLLQPGAPGNTRFLSLSEARRALFTQLISGLEFNAGQRLGRPLGTAEKPRPERAEARLSGRSLRNVTLSLTALRSFALAMNPSLPRSRKAFDAVIASASAMPEGAPADFTTPEGWARGDALRSEILALRDTLRAELGPALEVDTGFNSQDGD